MQSNHTTIRNVVFDIGNVIVRWDPALISARAFGDRATPELVRSLFAHPLWFQLNRGEITEDDAKRSYCDLLELDPRHMEQFFFHVKDTQALIPGTIDLMGRVSKAGYRLFALSDNVREIVLYLRQRYDFWRHFEGVVLSCELGILKPDAKIFCHLLEAFALEPKETIFLDDVARNVEGARAMNMHAIQFVDAERAEMDLAAYGLRLHGNAG
ncbi:MAG TPA: HAD family phosphatase [Alphaproteobacteria bacterium]|nr:HAD family phosphatase [Alphaproteobacteria bacterium]